MSAFEPYGTLPAELPDLLTELAAPRIPDYTDDVLAITAGTRQRPRWAHLERWLPMIITRQSLALSASLPISMLANSSTRTGKALIMPIWSGVIPLPLSQIAKYADPTPVDPNTVK